MREGLGEAAPNMIRTKSIIQNKTAVRKNG
jgi:hypothetical protein